MAALGVGLVFVGYAVGLMGYILVKGYNVTPAQQWSPIWPPGAGVSHSKTTVTRKTES